MLQRRLLLACKAGARSHMQQQGQCKETKTEGSNPIHSRTPTFIQVVAAVHEKHCVCSNTCVLTLWSCVLAFRLWVLALCWHLLTCDDVRGLCLSYFPMISCLNKHHFCSGCQYMSAQCQHSGSKCQHKAEQWQHILFLKTHGVFHSQQLKCRWKWRPKSGSPINLNLLKVYSTI